MSRICLVIALVLFCLPAFAEFNQPILIGAVLESTGLAKAAYSPGDRLRVWAKGVNQGPGKTWVKLIYPNGPVYQNTLVQVNPVDSSYTWLVFVLPADTAAKDLSIQVSTCVTNACPSLADSAVQPLPMVGSSSTPT